MSRLSWTRLVINEDVTVARHAGRTLISDHCTLWDVDALAKYMAPAPDTSFGHYTVKGRTFTTDDEGFSRHDAAGLSTLFDTLAAEFDSAPEATLTCWSIDGFRVVVTRDGRAVRINGRVADTIDGRMLLRATDVPGRTVAAYLPTPGGPGETRWQFVGAVQALCDDAYYASVLEAIAALTVDEMRQLEESRANA